jgi:hypothetical protein
VQRHPASLSRRTLVLGAAAALPGTRIHHALAQTPAASPVAVADQIQLYADRRAALMALGRDVVGDFLAGNDAAFADALAPEARAAFDDLMASGYLAMLETYRVEMALPELGVWFNGHYDGSSTMEGFFYQGSPASFFLEADEDQGGDVPSGLWRGTIAPGTIDLGIEITFTGTATDLAASLSIPAQGMRDVPLSGVAWHAKMPIGEMTQEQALPFAGSVNAYRVEYAWGDALLVITANATPDGAVNGFFVAASLPLPPDPQADREVTGRLPADNQMIVFWGGDTEFQNYHASAPAQRHAYDIVVWRDGASYRTTGETNEDYHIWGRPVLAPIAGTVVAVENTLPDIPPQGVALDPTSASAAPVHPAGNHVVIQADDATFIYLAHMQEGSVRVAGGDVVSEGQLLGLVGNSGNTSQPHIHIHAQTVADLHNPSAQGVPLAFTDYLSNGAPVDQGVPVQGEFVEHLPAS